jgi:phosphoglycerate dehydrogenase-like enzyme
MKIFMIGEAAKHEKRLSAKLPTEYEIIGLPREAAHAAEFDGQIAPEDVVISLRFSRRDMPVPAFRLLHVPGAGLDGIDLPTLPAAAMVCNVFEHEIPIGEFVVAAMLEWEIRLCEMRRSFSPETWSDIYRNRIPHGELYGKTLGILGFGRIGRAIAQRAHGFGLRILAVDAHTITGADLADEVMPPENLGAMLRGADYVAIACPLTDETRGLIGPTELGSMKRDAVLINISRAEIVKEEALFAALTGRTIGGAVLDVWYGYPTGADDQVEPSRLPFHALPNAICTPHSCAWTSELPERRYAFIARNLERLASGEPLLNVVRAPLAHT